MKKLSHLNSNNQINMVDINHKLHQIRIAEASGKIFMDYNTLKAIEEISLKKGDIIAISKIAGIQAAKQTPLLIPLCHQLHLEKINVDINIQDNHILVKSLVRSFGKTGVEIEALLAVQIALITIYDMCKAIDKKMIISEIKVTKKEKI